MKQLIICAALFAIVPFSASAQAPPASAYKAKTVHASVRDLGGAVSVKITPGEKTVTIREHVEWVMWTVSNVPRGARVRVDMKDPLDPKVGCHATGGAVWTCVSSTFFTRDSLVTMMAVPVAAAGAGAAPVVAKKKMGDEKHEYSLIVTTLGGKDYIADPWIIVQH